MRKSSCEFYVENVEIPRQNVSCIFTENSVQSQESIATTGDIVATRIGVEGVGG